MVNRHLFSYVEIDMHVSLRELGHRSTSLKANLFRADPVTSDHKIPQIIVIIKPVIVVMC